MGTAREPPSAILFAGILRADAMEQRRVEQVLEREFGRILLRSEAFAFTESGYYEKEMGPRIWRVYLAFDRMIRQDEIAGLKLRTNEIETSGDFSQDGKRRVNIDPGYLTSGKVVLATTKDHGHRVYLHDGIYAEVTLRYRARERSYMPWEWTYGDYRRDASIRFFNELRTLYRARLRAG